MRSFIALAIPEAVKAQLQAAIKRLAPLSVDVSWRTAGQIHLTLAFLGDTAPAILPHVSARLANLCAKVAPFTCRAYGLGFFGTKRNPKVIWAGVDVDPGLGALHEAIGHELKPYGFKADEDAFRPHITLGRCKDRARNLPLVQAMEADEAVAFGTWTVPGVTLFESRLTPKGSLYVTLNRFSFGG